MPLVVGAVMLGPIVGEVSFDPVREDVQLFQTDSSHAEMGKVVDAHVPSDVRIEMSDLLGKQCRAVSIGAELEHEHDIVE